MQYTEFPRRSFILGKIDVRVPFVPSLGAVKSRLGLGSLRRSREFHPFNRAVYEQRMLVLWRRAILFAQV
jgi:hypothetical protein